MKQKNFEELPELFTEKELREVVFDNNLSKCNTYALIHSKGFPTVKIGRKLYISKDGLKRWMETQSAT
jgi:excisionase family DNA binding protein